VNVGQESLFRFLAYDRLSPENSIAMTHQQRLEQMHIILDQFDSLEQKERFSLEIGHLESTVPFGYAHHDGLCRNLAMARVQMAIQQVEVSTFECQSRHYGCHSTVSVGASCPWMNYRIRKGSTDRDWLMPLKATRMLQTLALALFLLRLP
jgi:hypothetical protein